MISYTYIAAFTGNIIGFVAGTCLTWSSPELSLLKSTDTPLDTVYNDDSSEIAWIGALLPLGATFGPILFGYLANKIGRKLSILILASPFTVCYFMLAFGKNVVIYMVARFIIGIGVGGVFTVLPVYLGEVSEDSNRGAIGASMNCFICFGILFSYAVGPYVSWIALNVILAVCPIVFAPLFYLFSPETPHYLLEKGDINAAKQSLHKLRNGNCEAEFTDMQESIKNAGHGSFMDLFKTKSNKKALMISLGLVALQQFSGINAVLFFAQDIFKKAGSTIPPEVCSIFVGITQFSTSFVSPLVSDRLGRKILLIFSAVGMVIAEVPLGVFFFLQKRGDDISNISFLPILCLVVYIITYNSGFGPLAWSVSSELFPSNVKSVGSTCTAGVCWFIGFLITYFFSSISTQLGEGPTFWIFAAFCVVAAVFSKFYVIETKGKSITEIQKILSE